MGTRHLVARALVVVSGPVLVAVLHHHNVFDLLRPDVPPDTTVFRSGFEDGTWNGWQHSGDGTFAIDATCARSGSRSARLELRNDATAWTARAEIVPVTVRGHFGGSYARFCEEYWYGFSLQLRADWDVDDEPETIVQWHAVPDRLLLERDRNPPLALVVRGARLLLESRCDAALVSAADACWRPGRYDGEWVIDVGDVRSERGRWRDWTFCIRWAWSAAGGGFVRAWKDGTPVVDRAGANCFRDLRGGPYLKLGPYKWPWLPPPPGTVLAAEPRPARVTARVLWIDDVWIRRGD